MKPPDNIDQSLQAAVSLFEMLTLEMDKVSASDLPGTLQAITQAARNIFEAEMAAIVSINPIKQFQQEAPVVSGSHQWSESELVNIAQAVLDNEEEILIAEDLKRERPVFLNDDGAMQAFVAERITAPQIKRPLAVLLLGFKTPIQFGPDSKTLLRMFSNTAASMLYNTWSLNRYSRVAQIGQEINQTLRTTRQLFQKLVDKITDILDIRYFFTLAVYNSQSDSLDFFMSNQGRFEEANHPVGGACEWVIKQQQALVFNDMTREAEALGIKLIDLVEDGVDPKSAIFVPLVFRGASLGVLSAQQLEPNIYSDEDRVILELVGHHVALAINNLRLFRNLDGLNEIGQILVRELDSRQVLRNIVHQIREATRADIINLFPYSKVTKSFEFPPRSSGKLRRPDIQPPNYSRADDMAALALKKGEPVWADDSKKLYLKLGGNPSRRLGSYEQIEKIQSTAVLPLFIKEDPVGVLFVNFRQPQVFDAPQRLLISSLGNYAAIAISTSGKFDALTRRRVQEWEIRHDIDREIGSTLDLQQVMEKFLELTWEYLGGTNTESSLNSTILILNPSKTELEVKAAFGSNADLRRGKVISLQDERGLSYWAFKEKGPVLVGNVHNDPRYYEVDSRTKSELDIPLLDENNEAIGVISYESSKENAFTKEDQGFLGTLAERAVFAIKNAQAHEETERLVRELRATEIIETEIVRHLNYQKVFGVILTNVLKITKASAGQIMLYDPRRDDLYTVAERGVLPERSRERLPVERGIIGHVFRTQEAVNVNVCEESPWKEMYERFIPGVCWELAVPITEGRRTRGVINIESTIDKPFRLRDQRLVQRLADLAMIALQITERYERAKSGKKRLQTLHEVDKKIIEQLRDPDQVMRMVLQSALKLSKAETGDLHLYENGKLGTTYFTSRSGRRILEPHRIEGSEAEKFQRGIVAHVADTRQTYRTVRDAQADPYYHGRKDVHSEVAVPLVSGAALIGVLNLESAEHQAFDSETEELLDLFAGQAVIAIQKAGAYKLAEEESDRFRWLSEAGQKLGAITDLSLLDKAYEIVIDIVGENNDGQSVIRRFDPESRQLLRKKVGKPRQIPPFEAIDADDVEWIRAQGRTIVIHRVKDLAGEKIPKISDPKINSLVVTAIEFRNDYYGMLALSHEEENYFKEADIKLMEGLAYQLAITIHRLEAVQAQKEAEKRASDARMMSLIGKLAYDVNHRLGNDLPIVVSRTKHIRQQLINQGILSDQVRKHFDDILTNIGKSLSMTRQLRDDVGRFQKGKLDRSNVTISAERLVGEAVESFAIPETIDLQVQMEHDLAVVNVEPGLVYNALNNVVTNAVQAMPEGGRITIRAKNLERFVQLEIEDNGPGIATEDQEKIFNLFYTTKENGSGYGLWSAKLDSISNGGDLWVESELGKGATFFITLPRE